MNAGTILKRPVELTALASGHRQTVVATAEERRTLASAFALLDVVSLEGEYEGRAWRTNGAEVVGRVRAEIVQACVVTLEPVRQSIEEEVRVRFLPASERPQQAEEEIVINADDEDPPELVDAGVVDLGALTAEFLALGIDPYPRAPGADLAAVLPVEPDTGDDSPFAVLLGPEKSPTGRKGKRG
ncbi:MAG: DUF177 domain-containing protein [Bauldia sp.]